MPVDIGTSAIIGLLASFFLQFCSCFYIIVWLVSNSSSFMSMINFETSGLTPLRCRNFWMPWANPYETPWFPAYHHLTCSCLSILNLLLGGAHLYIDIRWMTRASTPFDPTLFCTPLIDSIQRPYIILRPMSYVALSLSCDHRLL